LSAEFLRISYNSRAGIGYLPRALASLVSGNWVTLRALDEQEYQETLLQMLWTMRMRLGSEMIGRGLTTTLERRLDLTEEAAFNVATQRASVNGSPTWGNACGGSTEYNCCINRKVETTNPLRMGWARHATEQYFAQSREVPALELVGIPRGRVFKAMLEASYNVEKSRAVTRDDWSLGAMSSNWNRHYGWVWGYADRNRPKQMSAMRMAVYHLFKTSLGLKQRQMLCALLGLEDNDLAVTEFDIGTPTLHFTTPTPYSDARAMARRVRTSYVMSTNYSFRV
jgi:hypothetical protein